MTISAPLPPITTKIDLDSLTKPTPTERSGRGTTPQSTTTGPDSAERPTAATGRPEGDHRTAEEIINANPTLKNLNYQPTISKNGTIERYLSERYLEGIYKHTGDWTEANIDPKSRADAAYNAARLFNFIDSPEAHAVRTSQHNDGFITGLNFRNQTQEHSEHALLSSFIKNGYSSLFYKGEQQVLERPAYPTGRPRGDHRTAEELINNNKETFKKIEFFFKKNQNSLTRNPNLKFQLTGDWRIKNQDPETRADAIYDIITAFNYISNLKGGQKINVTEENPLGDTTRGTTYAGFRTKADMFRSFFLIGYQALSHPLPKEQ